MNVIKMTVAFKVRSSYSFWSHCVHRGSDVSSFISSDLILSFAELFSLVLEIHIPVLGVPGFMFRA
jgi:hypothetical protein